MDSSLLSADYLPLFARAGSGCGDYLEDVETPRAQQQVALLASVFCAEQLEDGVMCSSPSVFSPSKSYGEAISASSPFVASILRSQASVCTSLGLKAKGLSPARPAAGKPNQATPIILTTTPVSSARGRLIAGRNDASKLVSMLPPLQQQAGQPLFLASLPPIKTCSPDRSVSSAATTATTNTTSTDVTNVITPVNKQQQQQHMTQGSAVKPEEAATTSDSSDISSPFSLLFSPTKLWPSNDFTFSTHTPTAAVAGGMPQPLLPPSASPGQSASKQYSQGVLPAVPLWQPASSTEALPRALPTQAAKPLQGRMSCQLPAPEALNPESQTAEAQVALLQQQQKQQQQRRLQVPQATEASPAMPISAAMAPCPATAPAHAPAAPSCPAPAAPLVVPAAALAAAHLTAATTVAQAAEAAASEAAAAALAAAAAASSAAAAAHAAVMVQPTSTSMPPVPHHLPRAASPGPSSVPAAAAQAAPRGQAGTQPTKPLPPGTQPTKYLPPGTQPTKPLPPGTHQVQAPTRSSFTSSTQEPAACPMPVPARACVPSPTHAPPAAPQTISTPLPAAPPTAPPAPAAAAAAGTCARQAPAGRAHRLRVTMKQEPAAAAAAGSTDDLLCLEAGLEEAEQQQQQHQAVRERHRRQQQQQQLEEELQEELQEAEEEEEEEEVEEEVDDDEEDEDVVMPGGLSGRKRARGGAVRGARKKGPGTSRGSSRGKRVICRNCGAHQTPQWRCGPEGPRTLCNACGVRYKKGLPLAYWEAKKKSLGLA